MKKNSELSTEEKEFLKEASLTDLTSVLEKVKDKLSIGSKKRDEISLLIGRHNDLLYEIKQSKKRLASKVHQGLDEKIDTNELDFYLREKNKIRMRLFDLINESDI
jgi:hypothetical protein